MTWRQRWDAYWFQPAPLMNLAVCRLVLVGFQLWVLGRLGFAQEIVDHAQLPEALYRPLPIFRLLTGFWEGRPALPAVQVVYGLTLAAGWLALIGLRTRWTLALFAFGSLWLRAFLYSFGELHHPHNVMTVALGLLALSPSGAALSWDALRQRWHRTLAARRFVPRTETPRDPYAGWALRLIQWLVGLSYFSAAWCKLRHNGLSWLNGYTLQYYLWQDALRWERPIGVWFAQQHELAVVLSWLTILVEVGFLFIPLLPWLKWLCLPAGVGLHTGIYLAMRAPFFQLIALYSAYLPWHRLQRRGVLAPRTEVLFDGHCPLCLRSMAVLDAADWLGRLRYTDIEQAWAPVARRYPALDREACRRQMHVLTRQGRAVAGFFAFRALAWELPAGWLVAPLLHVPGVAAIGDRVYRWVAARRRRDHVCTFDTCPTV